ncbi:MAG: Spy/CpxP family protein refolding chaperone [Pseudolabrys sp.]
MWKTVLAASTALAIAGGSLVYAQQGPGNDRGGDVQRWRPSAEDIAAFGDARIAGLKAGLKLTAEQEKLWPPVEAALKAMAKERSDRFAARASADRPSDPIERMKLRAERMTEMGTSLKALADAAGPLYAKLDDAQKQRFRVLSRVEGRRFAQGYGRGHHEWGRHHNFREMKRGMRDGEPGERRGPRQ